MPDSPPARSDHAPPTPPVQRLRLYGPSLITLAVLLPFFAYYLNDMKSAQGYLNDRAFRVLDVTSRQFGSEIAGIGNTLGAAYVLPGQLKLRTDDRVLSPRAGWLASKHAGLPEIAEAEMQSYLDTYVLDGTSSVKVRKAPAGAATTSEPESSPRISLCCRYGSSPLRIRFLQDGMVKIDGGEYQVHIDVKLDPERMLGRTVGGARGGTFETVVVASRGGQVLAESSSSRLTVGDVEAVLSNRSVRSRVEGGANAPKDAPAADTPDQSKLPRQVWGADQRFDVQASGTSYVLFVAPAPFVLTDENGKDTEIAFYGLAQKDEIDARARRIPSLSLPVIFITIIVGMAFLWPALKLYTMSDRDRLTKLSVNGMLGITVMAAILFSALYLSYGFFLDMADRSDAQIEQLSQQLRTNFARETGDAIRASESVLRKLRGANVTAHNQWPPDAYYLLSQSGPSLVERYPFLVHVMLLGAKPEGEKASARGAGNEPADLRQIVKFSATRMPTPLISLPPVRFDFIARLLRGQYATQNSTRFVIESFVSPSTGEFLPTLVFDPGNPENEGFRILATTQLPSLVHAMLPQGFGFAVIDPEGLVLFHADPSRNLHENFFGETDDAEALKAALRRKERKHLTLRYGGRGIRAFVQPLGCDESETRENCIQNLDMGLIVYQGVDEQKERLSAVGSDFLIYLLLLPVASAGLGLIAMSLKHAVWPAAALASARRRFWPREADKGLYLLSGIWGLACFTAAVVVAVLFRIAAGTFVALPLLLPPVLLVITLVYLAGTLVLQRRTALVQRLQAHRRIVFAQGRVPLSAAYAVLAFSVALAMAGVSSLMIYQLAVSGAQLRFESDGYRALAAAMENRKLRYLADFHKSFEDTPANMAEGWPEFCRNRVEKGYDAYDWRAGGQTAVLSLLRDAPILNWFSFFDHGNGVRALPDPCPPPATPTPTPTLALPPPAPRPVPLPPEPVWSALPLPSVQSSVQFYLPCLLLLIGMFLWIHRIVRRLFILDFRKPDPLPELDEQACMERMQRETLDRTLIFAHPRSGTGVAMERILKNLKEQDPSLANCLIIDFGKTTAAEIAESSALLEAATASKIAILDNFEVRLTDTKERVRKLAFLESLVYCHRPSIYVLTSIDPLLLMESLAHEQASEHLQPELARWTRLLGNFERFLYQDHSRDADLTSTAAEIRKRCAAESVCPSATEEYLEMFEAEFQPMLFLRACACRVAVDKLDITSARHFEASVVTQVRIMADGYYRVLWLNCTSGERLALYQLAKDNWLNPLNVVSISHLLQKQLIRRDGAYRLMNVSFREFVLEAVTAHELATWQKQQNLSLWPPLRMALGLALFLVVLFVSYFWRDIFDVYLSYFVALAGGAAALFRIVAQFFTKDGGKLTALAGGDSPKSGGAAG